MTNIYGCDNLLKLAVEKKARFLLASSVEIYGQGTAIPMNEEYCGWEYITQFAEFNRFTNSPVANYKGELYSLPFNMYTFNKMWGVVTPEEASVKIEEQRKEAGITEPKNLEEQAISLVGRDIYEKLIKYYDMDAVIASALDMCEKELQ